MGDLSELSLDVWVAGIREHIVFGDAISAGALPSAGEALPFSEGHDDITSCQPCCDECPICLESLEGEPHVAVKPHVAVTRCWHTFHTTCLVRWLRVHGNCPCCRTDLVQVRRRWVQ